MLQEGVEGSEGGWSSLVILEFYCSLINTTGSCVCLVLIKSGLLTEGSLVAHEKDFLAILFISIAGPTEMLTVFRH